MDACETVAHVLEGITLKQRRRLWRAASEPPLPARLARRRRPRRCQPQRRRRRAVPRRCAPAGAPTKNTWKGVEAPGRQFGQHRATGGHDAVPRRRAIAKTTSFCWATREWLVTVPSGRRRWPGLRRCDACDGERRAALGDAQAPSPTVARDAVPPVAVGGSWSSTQRDLAVRGDERHRTSAALPMPGGVVLVDGGCRWASLTVDRDRHFDAASRARCCAASTTAAAPSGPPRRAALSDLHAWCSHGVIDEPVPRAPCAAAELGGAFERALFSAVVSHPCHGRAVDQAHSAADAAGDRRERAARRPLSPEGPADVVARALLRRAGRTPARSGRTRRARRGA